VNDVVLLKLERNGTSTCLGWYRSRWKRPQGVDRHAREVTVNTSAYCICEGVKHCVLVLLMQRTLNFRPDFSRILWHSAMNSATCGYINE